MFTRCSLGEGGTRLSACGPRRRLLRSPSPPSPPRDVISTPGQATCSASTPAGGSPRPPPIRQVWGGCTSRQVLTPVPRVYLSAMLAAPAPSDSPGTPRLCRGCFPPSRSSPRSDCPQLHGTVLRHAPRCGSLTPTRTTSASRRTDTSYNTRLAGPSPACSAQSAAIHSRQSSAAKAGK